MFYWLVAFLLIIAAITIFFVIASKGRKLRTTRVLPPESSSAVLEDSNGKQYSIESHEPFYIGIHPDNQLILSSATQQYSLCIFYHRRRFAFQTYTGTHGIRVNGEDQLAGYLSNGDVLEVEGQTFVFRSK